MTNCHDDITCSLRTTLSLAVIVEMMSVQVELVGDQWRCTRAHVRGGWEVFGIVTASESTCLSRIRLNLYLKCSARNQKCGEGWFVVFIDSPNFSAPTMIFKTSAHAAARLEIPHSAGPLLHVPVDHWHCALSTLVFIWTIRTPRAQIHATSATPHHVSRTAPYSIARTPITAVWGANGVGLQLRFDQIPL